MRLRRPGPNPAAPRRTRTAGEARRQLEAVLVRVTRYSGAFVTQAAIVNASHRHQSTELLVLRQDQEELYIPLGPDPVPIWNFGIQIRARRQTSDIP